MKKYERDFEFELYGLLIVVSSACSPIWIVYFVVFSLDFSLDGGVQYIIVLYQEEEEEDEGERENRKKKEREQERKNERAGKKKRESR